MWTFETDPKCNLTGDDEGGEWGLVEDGGYVIGNTYVSYSAERTSKRQLHVI